MRLLIFLVSVLFCLQLMGQEAPATALEKMPENLETDFALSALPEHLRGAASVYLLDPSKGYILTRAGSNGFVCFVSRTEWEWGEFRKDLAVPMSYDAEGAKTLFRVYLDVARVRASGKYSGMQLRDEIVKRIKTGFYKAPAKGGISYMLAPIMRAYKTDPGDTTIVTVSVPHYMFYAPFISDQDLGVTPTSQQSFIPANPGNFVLGKGRGPFGIIITPVSREQKVKIVDAYADLLKRLADYKPYFITGPGSGHH